LGRDRRCAIAALGLSLLVALLGAMARKIAYAANGGREAAFLARFLLIYARQIVFFLKPADNGVRFRRDFHRRRNLTPPQSQEHIEQFGPRRQRRALET
jgi:hypothetical protein